MGRLSHLRQRVRRLRSMVPPQCSCDAASGYGPMGKRTRKRTGRPARRQRPLPPAVEAALAGIAHDIRTPLTGIVALAELLASSDIGQRERDWAKAVKSGAEHLAALASLIVDGVKADAAGLALRREPFSPRALAEAVGQAIAADLPPTVAGDAVRLRSALENLTDNAIKFTGEGTVTLTVGAAPAARGRVRLTFAVTDSGIGISARDLKQLFRPFAQANEEVARRYGGAGLGLVFVKRIAEAMGGDLTVASKPGEGTTFR